MAIIKAFEFIRVTVVATSAVTVTDASGELKEHQFRPRLYPPESPKLNESRVKIFCVPGAAFTVKCEYSKSSSFEAMMRSEFNMDSMLRFIVYVEGKEVDWVRVPPGSCRLVQHLSFRKPDYGSGVIVVDVYPWAIDWKKRKQDRLLRFLFEYQSRGDPYIEDNDSSPPTSFERLVIKPKEHKLNQHLGIKRGKPKEEIEAPGDVSQNRMARALRSARHDLWDRTGERWDVDGGYYDDEEKDGEGYPDGDRHNPIVSDSDSSKDMLESEMEETT